MATIKITQLPAADLEDIGAATLFEVVDELGDSVRLTLAQLRAALPFVLTLDGDVSAVGALGETTTLTVTIENSAITLAKLADIPTARLIGRTSGGTGVPELISLGDGLVFEGNTLNVAAAQSASDAAPLFDHRAFGGF